MLKPQGLFFSSWAFFSMSHYRLMYFVNPHALYMYFSMHCYMQNHFSFRLYSEQLNRSRWVRLCRFPRCSGWQRRSRRAKQSRRQPRTSGPEGRERCSRSVFQRIPGIHLLFVSSVGVRDVTKHTGVDSWTGELLKLGRSLFGVSAAAQPALAQKQQCWADGPSPSCSTHWAQQAANARGYSQPSAPQIFLMKLRLHKCMTPPSFCCKPVHIYLSPESLTVQCVMVLLAPRGLCSHTQCLAGAIYPLCRVSSNPLCC